ncbi:unnamed protein product [Haemonchus placei]|uniref:7TM_GPCR_Srx domain-containing protein n=1 Tax=Haemonchus placei TaxID=6290 RepID=A0A0N4X052_HAEPC|nr:unnamed protein product [Haemonchus placei]
MMKAQSHDVKLKAQSHDVKLSNCAIRRRRQTEVRFFWQTLCQNATFFYELSNFYYFCTLFENPWLVFLTSTFAWEICHALDGFVVVLFHFRFSKFRKTHVNGVATTMVVGGKLASHAGDHLGHSGAHSNSMIGQSRAGKGASRTA